MKKEQHEDLPVDGLSRRAFLKGAAFAAAMTATAGSTLAGCSSQKEQADANGASASGTLYTKYPNNDGIGVLKPADSEETFDFVVVGSGLTGLTAVMVAAEQMPEAKILLLEKLPKTGGSSNFAEINAPMASLSAADARKKALDLTVKSMYLKKPELYVSLYMDAGKNCSWLFNKQGVKLDDTNFYYEDRAGGKAMAGLTSKIKTDKTYAGIEVRLGTRATALLLADDHTCTGVQVKNEDGTYTNINAKAVMLATGGMGTNLDLLSYYSGFGSDLKAKCIGIGAGQSGDGHLMVENTAHGMSKEPYHTGMFNTASDFELTSPLSVAAIVQPTNIFINERGLRFADESVLNVYPFMSASKAIELQGKCFSVFGSNFKKYFESNGSDTLWFYYYKTPTKLDGELDRYKNSPCLFKSDTLEGLAKAMGVPADTLVKTVKDYSANASAGTNDPDYGKPASSMIPIGDGPYYGVRVFSGIISTNGGIRIDENCQVCDCSFTPIAGLFAGGIAVSGFNVEVYSTGTSQAVALWSGSKTARYVVENVLGGAVAANWFGSKEYDGPFMNRDGKNPNKPVIEE